MFHLLSSIRTSTSPHMYSGTRGRSGTVGNESYWQSAIFFTWYHRFHAGPYSHVYLSSLTACRIFKGKKKDAGPLGCSG